MLACLLVCLLAFACWIVYCLLGRWFLVVGLCHAGPLFVCQFAGIASFLLRLLPSFVVRFECFWSSLKERPLFAAIIAATNINFRMSSSQPSN